jgi:hypothetical protein
MFLFFNVLVTLLIFAACQAFRNRLALSDGQV